MFNRIFIALKTFGFGSQRAIPGLDGLRAVSIAFVFLAHLTGTRNFPHFAPFMGLGEFGVRVFFVISGYLITSILLNELYSKQTISLPKFYFRRVLRLFPAAYVLIGITAVLAAHHLIQLQRWDLPFALTYTMNFYDGRGWPLGHLWSLAVEEQFYLLWPLTLKQLGPGRATRLLIILLIISPLLRMVQLYVAPLFNFVVWSDALATGCILALARDQIGRYPAYSHLLRSRWFFVVPLTALAVNYTPSTKIYWLVSETIMNFAIGASIDWVMRNADGLVGRFLNAPAITFIGVLSYSLYLWQQPFLNRDSSSAWCAFPLNVVLAVALALASYLIIEAPFLRIRTTIERELRISKMKAAAESGEAPSGAANAVGSTGSE